jgi:hypothetical protein
MSLRTKFMLALLLTGLAAVAMVGGLAYVGMTKKVDSIRRERARSISMKLSRRMCSNTVAGRPVPARMALIRSCGGRQVEDRPPPPEGRRPPREDGGPGPESGRRGEPPFHFILADQNFNVVLGAGVYEYGEPLPESARKNARPVEVQGRVVAYVSPEGVLTPGKEEQQYLDAMRDALWFGSSSTGAGAGLLLSRSLGRTLGHLTSAVRAMHGGSRCSAYRSRARTKWPNWRLPSMPR